MRRAVMLCALVGVLAIRVIDARAGVTLGEPFWLNPDYNTDGQDNLDEDPALAGDGHGTWMAVWERARGIGEPEVGDIFFSVSTDGGVTWTNPARISDDGVGYWSDAWAAPALATDGLGNWVVVWVRQGYDILYATTNDLGANWSEPEVLSPEGANDYYDKDVRIATDGAGTWVAAWRRDYVLWPCYIADVLIRRSHDNGANWEEVETLRAFTKCSPERVEFAGLGLATDRHCTWIVSWGEYIWEDAIHGTAHINYRRSVDGALTWEPTGTLDYGSGGDYQGPRLAADSTGNWMAVWTTEGGRYDFDTHFVRSTDGGASWTSAVAIADDSDWQFHPIVATDAQGTWVVAWGGGTNGYEQFASYSQNLGATWAQIPLDNYPTHTGRPATVAGSGADGLLLAYSTAGELPVEPPVLHGIDSEILCAPLTPTCGPEIDGVYSTVTHGAVGPVRLAVGGGGVDSRVPGISQLEFEMSAAMDGASVTVGNVSIVDSSGAPYGGTVGVSLQTGQSGPNTLVVVTFDPALANAECWTVGVAEMTGGGLNVCNAVTTVRSLAGDANLDGDVTALDYSAVKLRLGQPVDETTCMCDVNADGDISSLDYSSIKPRLGITAPDCVGCP